VRGALPLEVRACTPGPRAVLDDLEAKPIWRASCRDRQRMPGDQAAGAGRKMNMRSNLVTSVLLIIPTLALLAAAPAAEGKRLVVRVSPRVAFAPARLVVDAVAEQDPANRALQIEVDSPEYHRSSRIQLDGDDAARTTTVRYDGVPGGMYEVRATLFGSDGQQRAATTERVQIISAMDR
jgi:hypothetical protein